MRYTETKTVLYYHHLPNHPCCPVSVLSIFWVAKVDSLRLPKTATVPGDRSVVGIGFQNKLKRSCLILLD